MKPSEKDRPPTDEGDLEQTRRTKKKRLGRKQRKLEGKTASKHHEDERAAITSRTSQENKSKQHRAETFLSPAEQSAVDAWLEHRKRASPGTKLPGDGPSAKKSRRPASLKPDARRATVTQAADMSQNVPQTRGVVVPEDICAGAMPSDIVEPASSDLGMNRRTPLWDSSVAIDQPSSDPDTSRWPYTPQNPINVAESLRDGQKPEMKILPMGRAPVLPPMGLARRVNRLVAAIALLGALNVLALALAWTSGTASRSTARDLDGQLAISEVKPQPTRAAEANSSTRVLAALPQQAGNADRLSRSIRSPQLSADEANDEATDDPVTAARSATVSTDASMRAPQPAVADRLPDRSLRSPVREKVSEREIPMPRKKPSIASRAAADSKRVLKQILDEEASESPASGNTGIDDDDTAVSQIDTGGQATDEAAATRLAAVSTAVNMRAKPDNAAAVIMVVPGKSDVEVIDCDAWCKVVFAGKRGWIYHRFVGAADSTAGTSRTAGVAGTTGRVAETTIPSAQPSRRAPVAIDGIGRLASLSADDLQKNLRALDLGDVRKLKTTCAEVLRSSAAYSANTRAVCKLVTPL